MWVYSFCFISRKVNLNKPSPTGTTVLDQFTNAIDNPGYATIEDCLAEDVHQANSVKTQGIEKGKTEQETKSIAAATKGNTQMKENTESKDDKDASDSAPSIHVDVTT